MAKLFILLALLGGLCLGVGLLALAIGAGDAAHRDMLAPGVFNLGLGATLIALGLRGHLLHEPFDPQDWH